jgi:uncharacterized protein YaiE (UPF0345 family)
MEFEGVKLLGPANVYFDGKVTSRTFWSADGTRKTLGFVQAGEYEFTTGPAEYMQILGGSLELRLPGESGYIRYEQGASFTIPAGICFQIRTDSFGDYCCTYLSER